MWRLLYEKNVNKELNPIVSFLAEALHYILKVKDNNLIIKVANHSGTKNGICDFSETIIMPIKHL